MEALHKAKIVHGNIKATNILLTPDGLTGMVADIWPTPPPTDGLEASVANYYDPEYLSTGTAKTTSDIYSMGVIMLELLTSKAGQVPKINEAEEAAAADTSASADPMEALQVAAVKVGRCKLDPGLKATGFNF